MSVQMSGPSVDDVIQQHGWLASWLVCDSIRTLQLQAHITLNTVTIIGVDSYTYMYM